MSHRGPDGAGLWVGDAVTLGHRRLIVIDPTPAGNQPMRTPDGRFVIVYNGELYNDTELRHELARAGVAFRSRSDTETLLHALAAWGPPGLARLRGMFALALWDARERTLLLARDPLGIKPLYYHADDDQVAFASEIPALLTLPGIRARPDLVTVSAYLTTIRTTLGERTLYDGVSTLRPGQAILFRLDPDALRRQDVTPAPPPPTYPPPTDEEATDLARAVVEDSVRRHLRSDVPLCCLLSGGLDSSIIAVAARQAAGELFTYCAGAPESADGGSEDFRFARLVADAIGAIHTEAPVTRQLFARRWEEMVAALGVPLGTPNEVAINEVARRMRSDGRIVTLSGEGADELFGGYDAPLAAAAAFETAAEGRADNAARGRFQLRSNAWIPPDDKPALLNDRAWASLEHDDTLKRLYEAEFDALARPGENDPMQNHLRFHRRINLAGLLQRLDTATMLAGVEGRTPFADSRITDFAESLPMNWKFRVEHGPGGPGPPRCSTKRVLREAFSPDLPPEVVERPKASFPLPFQAWVADHAQDILHSGLIRELFRREAIDAVTARPGDLWRMTWPMANLALWGKQWD
jgi:asparagine synthase (glutamine-hydrolysing)